jgi:hypothetical protein
MGCAVWDDLSFTVWRLNRRTEAGLGLLPLLPELLNLNSQFPDSGECGVLAWGRSERVSAMTRRVIFLEFVVPTVLAIALAILLSIGAVHLTDKYLASIDQTEDNQSVAGSQ